MILRTSLICRLGAILGLILIPLLGGCGDSDDPQESNSSDSTAGELGIIDTSTTLVNYHPVLDEPLRTGDTLIADLLSLVEEGIIDSVDMSSVIGPFVVRHGGMEKPDSVIRGLTYREFLRQALTVDLSGDARPCEGCTDSILIMMPNNSTRVYLGKGRKSLQTMIREALADPDDVPSEYTVSPLDRPVSANGWQEYVSTVLDERESVDWIVFGNTLLVMRDDKTKLSDYTYGQILAVVDQVRDMDEFDDIERLYEQTNKQ